MGLFLHEKVSGHEITSTGEQSRVLGPVCRRELTSVPPGLALTYGQDRDKMAELQLCETPLGPIARNNLAV